jgi:site-specific DNA-cytosine methylase
MIGKQKFKTTWGRLKWDVVSPTIDTRFDAASNGTNNHPCLNRAITPREAARLQSFDDSFVFCGSKVRIRKQIGNAVPPLMAKAIADKIYKELGK